MPYDIVERNCTQSDGGEGNYALDKRSSGEQVSCHVTRESAEAARRIRLQSEDKEVGGEKGLKADDEEIEQRFQEFQDTVNMSASEIEEWAGSDCADLASNDPDAVRNRVISLLRTPKGEWGDEEFTQAGRVISFVSRMSGMEAGDPASEDCPSERTISLMNWGFDPTKTPSTAPSKFVRSKHPDQSPMPVDQETLINFGGGLKVLGSGKQYGKDPGGPRVGGYGVVYTGPDDLDLDGQFFSKDTNFWLPGGSEGVAWPIYGHAQDPTLSNKRFSSEPWKVRDDDAGLWMEGQLEIADKYDEMILEEGIKPGKMGLSTGALPHLVSVSEAEGEKNVGEHIDDWPLYEVSITPQPSEFRTKLGLEVKGYGLKRLQTVSMPSAKTVCTGRWKAQHDYSEGDLVAWEGGSAQGRVVEVSTSGTARGSMEPEGRTHETSEENPGFVIQLVDREDGEVVGRTDGDGNPQTVFHRAGTLMSIDEEDVPEKEAPDELKELADLGDQLGGQMERTEANFGLSGVASNLDTLTKSFSKGTTLGQNLDQAVTAMAESNEDMSRGDVISEMAQEAGIEESTVRSIMGETPDIQCPPRSRLEALARVLDEDEGTVLGWARSDGCEYE